MTLRPALPADLDDLVALDQRLFGVDAWSAASVRDEVDAHRVVVAADPDLVGYVVTRPAGDAVDLMRIGVLPSVRRRGLARALLGAVTSDVRLLLEVSADNPGALAFYAAEGFEEIARRERYYRDGSDAVVMERKGQ
ncbi:MAG: GNAT family N-acetyltransferase [Nocardioidaceae bacterium]